MPDPVSYYFEHLIPGDDYEPVAYWSGEAGDIYESTCDELGYAPQEETLAKVLATLDWTTVLDVGCGFGRLAKVVRAVRPDADYTGVDVSPGQIANAVRRCPGGRFHVASLLDFDAEGRTWDLVLTAECLMHQPPADIFPVVSKLLSWSSGYVVNCDWYEPHLDPSTWCWPHDYPGIYGDRLLWSERVGEFYPWNRESIFVAKGRR